MAQAPSSSSFTHTYTYDVFLSFRGEDTRTGFTGNLYSALSQRGVLTFMDDYDLNKGEDITPSLLNAIQKSRMSFVIFSKNYASSTFCLNELGQILECYTKQKMLIWPIFYDVDPSEVRYQKGSYGEAFAKYEQERFKNDIEKVKKWRLALRRVADLSGSHFKHGGGEYEHVFIRNIIERVSRKLNRPLLQIADYPIGLEARIRNALSVMGAEFDNKVNMLGIHGIGGIGKSTIARAIYNLIAHQFEGSCFLANIREKSTRHGLEQIQETMLCELIGERNFKLGDVNQGIQILKERLQQKKVLLILDDVDKREQLQATAGGIDWFGSGSTIIITTRDKHLLDIHGVKNLSEVKKLNDIEALELFSWNALKNKQVHPSYMEIIKRAVHYGSGLPLALETIGSNLFGKALDEWKSALEAYEGIPNKDIQDILKVSYDGLEENEKEIFLDIACFFKGCSVRYISSVLQARGFHPKYGIGVLEDKSLINIWRYNGEISVTMHDLIQSMGKEIVRQQSITMPEKRNRLWFYKDLIYVLEKNMENDEIEAMVLDMPEDKEVQWNQEVLGRMKKLRMLVKKNACFFGGPKNLPSSLRVLEWWKYPEASLPHNFHSKNLVILNLSYSSFQWNKQLENSEVLSQLIFTGCVDIRQIPDVSGIPNLTELCVDDCTNLIGIHDSVGFLDKLLSFSAKGCSKLRIVPHGIRLTSLEYLCLRDCCSLIMFPEILGPMERLEFVDLEGTAIKNLPLSMQNLKGVQRLYLNRCRMIESNALSDIIQRLPNLFPFLKSLRLRGSSLTILPECIEECRFLELLDLCYCKQLREIRGLPLSTDDFLAYNCTLLKANCSTLNMLIQSRAIRSATRKFFVLPGKRIPEWFDHSSRGNSLCFWFRKDFPSITVSAVLGVVENIEDPFYVNFHFYVKINDIEIPFGFDFNYILETDHIFMFKSFTDPKYWGQGGLLSENEWNYGEVLFVIPPDSGCTGSIKCTGVHINRTFSRMEDVQFTNPYPSKMTCYTNQSALPNPEFQMWLRSSMQPHWEQPLDELYSSPASLSPTPDFSTGLLSGPPASSIKRQTLVHKTSQLCKDRDKSPSYAVLLLHFYTKVVSKIRMHGLFGRKYLLSFLFVCLLCLVILLDPYGYRYKPDGALLDHQAKDLGESSQAPGFAETQNIQAHSPTSSSGGEVRPELHVGTSSTMFPTVDASPRNQTEPAEDDVEMEAFYVSLDADTCVVSWEETRKALKIVQDLISKDASVFLHPKLASVMKTNLEYRSNSSADDDISRDIRLQLSETSLESTHWCWDDYIEARMKIESTVEANKNQFWEVVALENELRQKLAWMEGKKKYLEEQINVIKANIAASQSEKNMASQRKRDIFKEGKKLKAQRYELREQAPYSQDEHGWENETQTRIKSEWPEFREYFEGIATEGDE